MPRTKIVPELTAAGVGHIESPHLSGEHEERKVSEAVGVIIRRDPPSPEASMAAIWGAIHGLDARMGRVEHRMDDLHSSVRPLMSERSLHEAKLERDYINSNVSLKDYYIAVQANLNAALEAVKAIDSSLVPGSTIKPTLKYTGTAVDLATIISSFFTLPFLQGALAVTRFTLDRLEKKEIERRVERIAEFMPDLSSDSQQSIIEKIARVLTINFEETLSKANLSTLLAGHKAKITEMKDHFKALANMAKVPETDQAKLGHIHAMAILNMIVTETIKPENFGLHDLATFEIDNLDQLVNQMTPSLTAMSEYHRQKAIIHSKKKSAVPAGASPEHIEIRAPETSYACCSCLPWLSGTKEKGTAAAATLKR